MNILSAADTAYSLRFVRLLTMDWKKTAAFRRGVINEKGERITKILDRKQKESYTLFHRIVFNIRRLIEKIPGNKFSVWNYASALLMLRENTELSDNDFLSILECAGVEVDDLSSNLYEDTSMLIPGTHGHLNNNVLTRGGELIGDEGDVIIIKGVEIVHGVAVYRAIHQKSDTTIFITPPDFTI